MTADHEKLFRLSLKGDGIAVDKDIAETVALQIVALLMGGRGPTADPGTGVQQRSGPGGPVLSLREKLDAAQATRWPDKIVVIGQHLHDTGQANFTKAEIRNQITAAREGQPGNYDRDFAWTARIGWVAPNHDDASQLYVTQKGRDAIKGQFSKEVKKATQQPKVARRRKKATSPSTTS